MYSYEEEINRECKAQAKRWNGKVISTSRQWTENAYGAVEAMTRCMMQCVTTTLAESGTKHNSKRETHTITRDTHNTVREIHTTTRDTHTYIQHNKG